MNFRKVSLVFLVVLIFVGISNAGIDWNIYGGEVGTIWVNSSSTVTVSKGSIGIITVGSNISDEASITFDCNLDSLNKTYDTDLLVGVSGNWNGGSSFDIQIDNLNPNHPTGDFVQFVPEPISIALLGFGELMIRIRKSYFYFIWKEQENEKMENEFDNNAIISDSNWHFKCCDRLGYYRRS